MFSPSQLSLFTRATEALHEDYGVGDPATFALDLLTAVDRLQAAVGDNQDSFDGLSSDSGVSFPPTVARLSEGEGRHEADRIRRTAGAPDHHGE